MRRVSIIPLFVPPGVCQLSCRTCHPTAGRPVPPDRDWMLALRGRIRAALESGESPSQVGLFGGPLRLAGLSELLEFCRQALQKEDAVRLEARPDQLVQPSGGWHPSELAERGVETIELAVTTFNPAVLTRMGEAHGEGVVRAAVAGIRAAGIRWGATLRPGLPGSTPEGELSALEPLIALSPDFVRIYPALCLRGTWLERGMADGWFRPMSLDAAVSLTLKMVDRLEAAGIPVARVGLQPMRDLEVEADAVVAGPFHPSLRTLVDTERCFARAIALVEALPRAARARGRWVFEVSPELEPLLRGPGGRGVLRLRSALGVPEVDLIPEPALGPGDIRLRMPRLVPVPNREPL